MSATIASAACLSFQAAGSGQNIVNYCGHSVIVAWRSSDGGCSSGGLCTAVVGGGSWSATSNPYYAGVTWWECAYDDYINGYCTLPQ